VLVVVLVVPVLPGETVVSVGGGGVVAPLLQPESVTEAGHVGALDVLAAAFVVAAVVVGETPLAGVVVTDAAAAAGAGSGAGGAVVSVAVAASEVSVETGSIAAVSTAAGGVASTVSTAVLVIASSDADSIASVAEAGVELATGGGVVGAGGSRNEAGSMPTLLETIVGAPVAVAGVPSLNDVGSTPTELVTTGGDGVLGVAAVEDAEATGSGGVTSRLSLTMGTRTVRVAWCCFSGCAGAIACVCVACWCAAAGALNTSGGAVAFVRGAFAGTVVGTRSPGKRREAMLSACRE
jgi:hypothetical protein